MKELRLRPRWAAVLLALFGFSHHTQAQRAGDKIVFCSDRDGNAEIYAMKVDGSNQTNLSNNGEADAEPAFSADGTRIAFTSRRDRNLEIYVMNSDGSNQTRLTNNAASDTSPTFSRDRGRIAFTSQRDGNSEIYVMNADGSNQTRLTSNGAFDTDPTFSPDGSRIAFASNRDGNYEIYVMNANGSNVINLTNSPGFDADPEFSPDGSKIAFTSFRDGLGQIYVMNADGSHQTRLTSEPPYDTEPAFSPDGSKIAFTTNRDGGYTEIYVMNADGSNQRRLTNNPEADAEPSFGGQPDSDGDAVPDPRDNCPTTPNPERIAFSSGRDRSFRIYVMNADGSNPTTLATGGSDLDPAFSLDGRRIAFASLRDGDQEIWVMNANGWDQTQLTSNTADDAQPAFSPDRSRIAFTSNRDGNNEIYVMNADGTNQARLTNSPSSDVEPTFSPDGSKIAFRSDRDGNNEIYVMNSNGSNQTRLTNQPAADDEPTFSRDGSKIAFRSDRDGDREIYVMNSDGSNQTRLTNHPAFDDEPTFSPDGSKIAFRSERNGNLEIYLMNADGTSVARLTNHGAPDGAPSFGVQADSDGDGIGDACDDAVANGDAYSTNEDTPLSVPPPGVLANDTGHFPIAATLVSNPSHAASFTLNANGSFTYTPAADFHGTDSFTYRATDGPYESNTVAVTIAVTSQPDTFTVTKTADTDDGACNADCSLREAIARAEAGDTIVFSALFNSPQTITLVIEELIIYRDVTIAGKGANLLTISGNHRTPIFNIQSGTVSLRGMTVTNGSNHSGGGIVNNATLYVTDCAIVSNLAITSAGGILNLGTLQIANATISGNIAHGSNTGGGIVSSGFSTLTMANCTVSGNAAPNGSNNGGGIWTSGTTFILSSTITDNQGSIAGGIYRSFGTATVTDSIVAGNRNNQAIPDLAQNSLGGSFASGGFNLVGHRGAIVDFNQAGDQTGSASSVLHPMLTPLGNHGGATQTHALFASSPALDAGKTPFGFDQRGLPRYFDYPTRTNAPGSDGSDIGAYESEHETYAYWASYNFPSNASPALTAYDADYDRDGIANGLERALGLDPLIRNTDPSDLQQFKIQGGNLVLQYERLITVAPSAILAEQSLDLKSWTSLGITYLHLGPGAGATELIQALIPMESAVKKFGRLRATP